MVYLIGVELFFVFVFLRLSVSKLELDYSKPRALDYLTGARRAARDYSTRTCRRERNNICLRRSAECCWRLLELY